MEGLLNFLSWVLSSVHWWLALFALPFIRMWWDSMAQARYKADVAKGVAFPEAEVNEIRRVQNANMLAIIAAGLFTVLGITAAYQVDQATKMEITSLGEGLKKLVRSLETQDDTFSKFKDTVAYKSELKVLERCTLQWFVGRMDKSVKVGEECFLGGLK